MLITIRQVSLDMKYFFSGKMKLTLSEKNVIPKENPRSRKKGLSIKSNFVKKKSYLDSPAIPGTPILSPS